MKWTIKAIGICTIYKIVLICEFIYVQVLLSKKVNVTEIIRRLNKAKSQNWILSLEEN